MVLSLFLYYAVCWLFGVWCFCRLAVGCLLDVITGLCLVGFGCLVGTWYLWFAVCWC